MHSSLASRASLLCAYSTCRCNPNSAERSIDFLPCTQDAEGNWRIEVIKRLEKLKSLDGALIEDEEREQAKAESA